MSKYQEALDYIREHLKFRIRVAGLTQMTAILNSLRDLQELIDIQSQIEDENKELREQIDRYKRLNPDDLSWTINPCRGCEDYCYKNDRCKSNGGCSREEELIKIINVAELDPAKKYLIQVKLPSGCSLEARDLLRRMKKRLDLQGLDTTIYVGDINVKEVENEGN